MYLVTFSWHSELIQGWNHLISHDIIIFILDIFTRLEEAFYTIYFIKNSFAMLEKYSVTSKIIASKVVGST